LGDGENNFDPFIIYGVQDFPDSRGIGPQTAVRHSLYVVVVLQDNGNDSNLIKRLWRYQRALRELFEFNWATAATGKGVKFVVGNLTPTPLELLNRSQPDRAIGITLDVVIA